MIVTMTMTLRPAAAVGLTVVWLAFFISQELKCSRFLGGVPPRTCHKEPVDLHIAGVDYSRGCGDTAQACCPWGWKIPSAAGGLGVWALRLGSLGTAID